MLCHALKSLVAALALGCIASATTPAPVSSNRLISRQLTEYLMPFATATHEFARVPHTNFLLLTQMSNSELVKIELDPATDEPIAYHSFPMGKNNKSMLHGVWPSTKYPGLMWLSLQGDNKLLLVDPGQNLSSAPSIKHTIDIPKPGNGPHCVFEIGDRVWAGLKEASEQTGGYYVFAADINNLNLTPGSNTTGTNHTLYPSLNSPVFIAEDPTTGLIYVTQDTDSSIMRINTATGETTQLPIPPSIGTNAVGMISIASGPLRGIWFTLAGNGTGGTGAFGHIGGNGTMRFFSLQDESLGLNAGLLHLADASPAGNASSRASVADESPALWLLSTSLLSTDSPDALIRVTFDDAGSAIAGEEYISMQTQNAMVHRVLTLGDSVFVSELNTFTLAQLKYRNTVPGRWLPAEIAGGENVYAVAG
ncbi:uncharacterized protein DSM5745_00956 [Aspergillus mulundensis]|uniref:Uncharacterized protein n=1 Tax=Aspergillus mulundensis TaxID=1810919 RepID=A0A3D8T541_9EURO|nr:Uncharacterized protein DSM5745_00956 [Aspergillus mulundensis]RDW93634.1 Uncharacterized protein DSM5745_00956 [Aspergillus mulundensis]